MKFVLLLVLLLGRKRGARPGKAVGPVSGGFRPSAPRPPGEPPGGCVYSPEVFPTQVSVRDAFAAMGYPVPADRNTMNALGKDGKLGGGDDVASPAVARFQDDYNAASHEGVLGPAAGGLAVDGFVGPCVLSAIQHVRSTVGYAAWGNVLKVARG